MAISLQGVLEGTILLLLIYTSYTDIRWRLISNRTVLLTASCSLLLGLLSPDGPSLILPLLLLTVGIILSTAGIMGGGDVKLLCALTIALPATDVGHLLILIALAGLPVTLLMLLATALKKGQRTPIVPYGVAIMLGYILFLIQSVV